MVADKTEINKTFEQSMLLVLSEPEKTFAIGKDIKLKAKMLNDELLLAKGHLLQSFSGFFLGVHEISFEYVNIALPIFIKFDDKKNQAAAYNTLGYIYNYFEDHESRLEINLKSLKIRKKIGDTVGYATSLNNTGDTYLSLNKIDKALEYFSKSLENTPLENVRQRAITIGNIAETYFKKNDFERSLSQLRFSNKLCEQIELHHIIIYNKILQAKIFNGQKKYRDSIILLNSFVKNVIEIEKSDLAELYLELSISYEFIDDHEQSLKDIKKHFNYKEQIAKEKQEKDLKSLKFRKKINQLEDKTKNLESLVEIRTSELKMALESEKIISFFSR